MLMQQDKSLEELVKEGEIAINELPVLKKAKTIIEEERLKPYAHNKVRGLWIQGAAGSGKDYTVRQWCEREGLSLYVKTTKDKFFNGYKGEQVILWTNVEIEDLKYLKNHLKIWTDRYAW